jgi:hypothetical protein
LADDDGNAEVIPVAPDAPAGEHSWVEPPPPAGDGPTKVIEVPDE